ncbi:Imidazoleglycerol-phosphate dehydratase [Frankliniella fusca]|uniref:Imidazoleglycerol-phosphate dehydratase n=1 Tax=Frankliniella fusca TaxID=407009 RepID=A0AAE1H8S5_9NEOP|nr:Imidazoleglycerol-phosphate dehydratase [Frankliniella fusca]
MKVLSAYLEMGFVDAKKKNHRMRLRCHGKRYGDKQHSGYECCAIRFEGHFLLFFSHIMSMAIFLYVKCELFPQDLQICT